MFRILSRVCAIGGLLSLVIGDAGTGIVCCSNELRYGGCLMENKMVKIETLYDWKDCDQGGCSGGDAYGGRIFVDDVLVFEHIPVASCFGSESCSTEDLLAEAIRLLGHDVEVVSGEE